MTQESAEQEELSSRETEGYSRRTFLGVGSTAALAGAALVPALAAYAQQPADVLEAEREKQPGGSASNPGPENTGLAALSPDSETTPPTDHGDTPTFWYSFALARKRVESGGWARQVNMKDLPLATEIAAVNMRLTAGGVRELHWHAAAEWSIMLTGSCRLTAIDNEGNSYVQDVHKGDLWYFPTGVPHSIQGLGPDGCEFLLVFDDGRFSEFDTTLISDWTAHTPREVLVKNWGVPASALASMPKEELYIFQTSLPGSLDEDQRAARGTGKATTAAFDFKASIMPPTFKTASGEVRVIDSRNFPMSITMAAAIVRLKPGGLRELHWHPGADEWQYWVAGRRAHDALHQRRQGAHNGLPRRRYRLCAANLWTLHREHRDNRPRVPGDIQGEQVRGLFPLAVDAQDPAQAGDGPLKDFSRDSGENPG